MAGVEFNQQRLRKSVRQMSKICGKAGKKARNPVPTKIAPATKNSGRTGKKARNPAPPYSKGMTVPPYSKGMMQVEKR